MAPKPIKGRGAASAVPGRFERTVTETVFDDAPAPDERDGSGESPPRLQTVVSEERARRVISRNDSPDVGFGQSINPYRGCEHGCVYCFARPSHAYLDLSPGLDFETRLFAKTNAVEAMLAEWRKPGYVSHPIALGINTDAYQPIERRYRLTRSLLEKMLEHRHPVSLVTKSALVLRDLDLLSELARHRLVHVYLSVTSLDNRLSARLEPRASAPHARLRTIAGLAEAGIPVGVMVAPVIPMLTDCDLEAILDASREAGAQAAGYVLLRLPHELKQIWREWLSLHYPQRAAHIISLIRQMHGGQDYDSQYGRRMRGSGPLADLIAMRFRKAYRRLGYARLPALQNLEFRPPAADARQGCLF